MNDQERDYEEQVHVVLYSTEIPDLPLRKMMYLNSAVLTQYAVWV